MKYVLLKFIASLILLAITLQGHASTLESATYMAQVQVHMDKSAVAACGVVLNGFENKTTGSVYVFNGSVMVSVQGAGIVKGRISQIDTATLFSKNFRLSDLKPLAASDIWLKAKNSKATSPIQRVQKSEDTGYVLYISDSTANILTAILTEEEFQIGFQVTGKNYGNVMYGKAHIRDDEKAQLQQCLVELLSQMDTPKGK